MGKEGGKIHWVKLSEHRIAEGREWYKSEGKCFLVLFKMRTTCALSRALSGRVVPAVWLGFMDAAHSVVSCRGHSSRKVPMCPPNYPPSLKWWRVSPGCRSDHCLADLDHYLLLEPQIAIPHVSSLLKQNVVCSVLNFDMCQNHLGSLFSTNTRSSFRKIQIQWVWVALSICVLMK